LLSYSLSSGALESPDLVLLIFYTNISIAQHHHHHTNNNPNFNISTSFYIFYLDSYVYNKIDTLSIEEVNDLARKPDR